MTKLSDRVRPDAEAAPWVVEEIKKLEARLQIQQCLTRTVTDRYAELSATSNNKIDFDKLKVDLFGSGCLLSDKEENDFIWICGAIKNQL